MIFNTKINLTNNRVIQESGNTLSLSGNNSFYGSVRYIDGNQDVNKALISDVDGNAVWSGITTTINANNGLQYSGTTVYLGGNLIENTSIDLNNNWLRFVGVSGNTITGFTSGSGFNNDVFDLGQQSNNNIIVVGNFTTYSGQTFNKIISLNTDGSIVNSFNIGTGFNGSNFDLAIQSDDKILVGGDFTTYSGQSYNRIIRLDSDGSIDNTFDVGLGFNNAVLDLTIQSDNKILVVGNFTEYNFGFFYNRIIRLNTDGTVDGTFNIGSGFNSPVYVVKQQSDGKILVGGFFSTYSGVTSNNIIRLNSDGTIDNTFDIGSGFNGAVNTFELQSDNKILVGGNFTEYSATTSNYIIRLNSDGTIDNTFDIGTGFNNVILDIKIQSDNKILVGGGFTIYNGQSYNRIIRLNSDGSIDNTFNIGTGFNDRSQKILIQHDDKILVGGEFTSYSGNTANYIIRLETDGSIDLKIVPEINVEFNNGLLNYLDDYSHLYENNTLVDKQYVDDLNFSFATGSTNLGGGEGFLYQVINSNVQLKSLVAGNNTTITSTNDEITINSTGGDGFDLTPLVATLIFAG